MTSKAWEFMQNHQNHALPEYESREGTHEWTGQWELNRRDMTWWRPQLYYFRSARSGKVEQFCQLGEGPMVRPGPLRDVVHLDVPLAVLRSHPDTPGALPEDIEGMWTDTNPAWPEMSIDSMLGKFGVRACWEDSAEAALKETYELGPHQLSAVVVYVEPGYEPAVQAGKLLR